MGHVNDWFLEKIMPRIDIPTTTVRTWNVDVPNDPVASEVTTKVRAPRFGGIEQTLQKVRFRELPHFSCFFAYQSDKLPEDGYYVRVTKTDAVLVFSELDPDQHRAMERFVFSPDYEVFPHSLRLEIFRPVQRFNADVGVPV